MRTALTAAALLAVVLAGPAGAHQGHRVFPIYELPTSDLPDLHDGTLADWEDVLPDASLDHIDLKQITDVVQVVDLSDLAIRVFLVWHSGSQRVLVGVEWVDDVYVDPSEALMRDLMTFMIDGDHSGGRYDAFSPGSDKKLLEQSQAQSYIVAPVPWPEETIRHQGAASPWVIAPPWSDVGRSQEEGSPSHVVMEMYFSPWDQLHWEGPERSRRTELKAGKIIGFQLLVADSDDVQSFEVYMIGEYSQGRPSEGVLFNADLFADGELIPCFRGDCSGATTAVSQDSWGRIKASLR